ncbi:MAG: hypothetical protein JWN34_2807 [Bryobacterales bacterium]|nr:hypothetical protein [Bryobacterales bacterium]
MPQVQLKAVTPPDIRHRSHPDRRRLPAHRNHHTGVHRGRGCKRNRGPGRARVASSARLVALGFYFGSDHDQYLGARPPSARALIFRDRPGIPQNRPQLNKSRMNLSDRSSACESPSRRSSFTNLVSHVGPLNRRPSWLPNTTVAVERIASSVPASRPIMLTPNLSNFHPTRPQLPKQYLHRRRYLALPFNHHSHAKSARYARNNFRPAPAANPPDPNQ